MYITTIIKIIKKVFIIHSHWNFRKRMWCYIHPLSNPFSSHSFFFFKFFPYVL